MGVFLDIEGSFNKPSVETMVKAARAHGVDETTGSDPCFPEEELQQN